MKRALIDQSTVYIHESSLAAPYPVRIVDVTDMWDTVSNGADSEGRTIWAYVRSMRTRAVGSTGMLGVFPISRFEMDKAGGPAAIAELLIGLELPQWAGDDSDSERADAWERETLVPAGLCLGTAHPSNLIETAADYLARAREAAHLTEEGWVDAQAAAVEAYLDARRKMKRAGIEPEELDIVRLTSRQFGESSHPQAAEFLKIPVGLLAEVLDRLAASERKS